MANLVYFSSISENTHRFIKRLGLPADRIPVYPKDGELIATEPYVLVVPTYGGGDNNKAVPKQVIKFLNNEQNRGLIRGVISAGNTNFGDGYCVAGDIISYKCQVPHMYKFELLGTDLDLKVIREGLEAFWATQQPQKAA